MFAADSLLLTTTGYKRLDEITEPVTVISEFSRDGWMNVTEQVARVTYEPTPQRPVHVGTPTGRRIIGDFASLWFMTKAELQAPRKRKFYKGEWQRWQQITEDGERIVTSREGIRGEVNLTEDDWVFYAYGYNDHDDMMTYAIELPLPEATKEELTYKNIADRRQEWPPWYWELTTAEKILFLRGFWDRHGRIAASRIMLACANISMAHQLVLAHSEFGIRGMGYVKATPLGNKLEEHHYIFDIRNKESAERLANTICWIEPKMPSYRFRAIHRYAQQFTFKRPQPPRAELEIFEKFMPKQNLYRVEVETTHNCIINGLVVRDSFDTA